MNTARETARELLFKLRRYGVNPVEIQVLPVGRGELLVRAIKCRNTAREIAKAVRKGLPVSPFPRREVKEWRVEVGVLKDEGAIKRLAGEVKNFFWE